MEQRMNDYNAYIQSTDILPCNRSWILTGNGIDHFVFSEESIPEPGDNEVLMRVDAVSICFSDIKLIRAGNDHPRVLVPLEERPTVPGHEVSLSVMRTGKHVADMFTVGSRYIIQADIFKDGEIDTFGYTQRGGMALYVQVKETAINGDAGCYLLPLQEHTGFSEAALVEPWACVEASYHIAQSHGITENAELYVHPHIDISEEDLAGARILRDLKDAQPDCALIPSDISGEEYTDVEHAVQNGGVIGISVSENGGSLPVDAGAIHYRNLRIVAADSGDLIGRIDAENRTGLVQGGKALFVGAGGPMGQMHVQRAVELENGPEQVVVTDISSERLEFIFGRFSETARERDVDLKLFDASGSPEELRKKLLECSDGGFDDIVLLAPLPALVEESQYLASSGCVINIFAGIPLGSPFMYDPEIASEKELSFTGSSGSSLEDLKRALSMVETGIIRSDRIVRAIGGLRDLKKGVQAVADGAYAGKVVIYPHLEHLPLTALEDLADISSEAAEKLDCGHWNRSAERELFNTVLKGGTDEDQL